MIDIDPLDIIKDQAKELRDIKEKLELTKEEQEKDKRKLLDMIGELHALGQRLKVVMEAKTEEELKRK